jgi:membrane protein DedA with SNARE-associated domain
VEQQILGWISQYGYFAIFALLMFGIAGLPIPDETLLTFCGFLVFKGQLSLPLTFCTALAGSICGITLSYVLGRMFGMALIHSHGKYLRITEEHVHKAHAWFARVGHWSLTFGYFTAYAAGMSELEPPQFALFAYSGAVLWVSAFLSLGYFLGERWKAVEQNIHNYLVWLAVAGAIALAAYLVWRKVRARRR